MDKLRSLEAENGTVRACRAVLFHLVNNVPLHVEFIRRFLLHVLPDGFMRIRHFGFLANRTVIGDVVDYVD